MAGPITLQILILYFVRDLKMLIRNSRPDVAVMFTLSISRMVEGSRVILMRNFFWYGTVNQIS